MYSQKFGRVQPDDVSSADSFLAEVPGVDVHRFRNALATDQMREPGLAAVRSMRDGSLVLVAADEDAEVAKRVVAVSGAELDTSGVRHGTSRFVP